MFFGQLEEKTLIGRHVCEENIIEMDFTKWGFKI